MYIQKQSNYYDHYCWCRLMDKYLEAAKCGDREEMAFIQLCMDKEKEKPSNPYER